MSDTLELAMELIGRPSVTPDDVGCQEIMIARLETLGFQIQRLRFGAVDNFWARYGDREPLLVFAGHTDIVPPGPLAQWHSDPFTPTLRDGYLYGRGAADMKGSLAAMITACERFLAAPHPAGSIGFLITSDEEGEAIDGTVKVVEFLQARGERIDYCLIGEPSSHTRLGDEIKNGRRGSLNGRLTVRGIGGHVAYPHLVRNPIHACGPIITALAAEVWDRGDTFFPPTSLQISNIHAGAGTVNVVPETVEMLFNLRFSPAVTAPGLQARIEQIIATAVMNEEIRNGTVLQYDLEWKLSGLPFITPPGELLAAVTTAVRQKLGIEAQVSTGGGTSDGRFIAPTGAQVVELGPVNATIHKVNECVAVEDLDRLSRVYERVLSELVLR
ncbi:MAG TPA: succinyl-diaminopimelate desuccinylase [Candidatus Competibacteraceae bacterium]|nr:succinyl-diaminopimelate desuccinylase [Candidatus Competibacteraceae bacterium]